MAPKTDDCPTGIFETPALFSVTLDVPRELRSPVAGVCGGAAAALRAAMPEATVNEHCDLPPAEREVWPRALDAQVSAPTTDASCPHRSSKLLLE
jgi:sugar (pentulose or hexulose) kinase